MKIIMESIQDIETFLKSKEAKDLVSGITNDEEACSIIVDECRNKFDDNMQPSIERVFVISVDEELTDTIDDSHFVVRYNNYYYDYTAYQYNEAFDVAEEDCPVIQPVLPESRLTNAVSTIKRYALLKYI